MQLHEWQRRLQHGILGGTADPAFARHCHGADAARGLAVYADAYELRLAEALQGNYPLLHRLLGDDDFAALARAYLHAHPSRSASIRWFGEALADYLAAHAPWTGCPALAELARFEWALRHALDAADAERASAEALRELPPQDWAALRFPLHPSVTLLDLQWNVIPIWRALDADGEPPPPCAAPAHWIVHRGPRLEAQWRSATSPAEVEALGVLRDGGSFGEVCVVAAHVRGEPADAALEAARWLGSWIAEGLLQAPLTDTLNPATAGDSP